MPTISREKIRFESSDGSKEFVREIKVSSVGTFTIELPQDVRVALEQTEVRAATRIAVLEEWDAALKAFYKKQTKRARVILYSYQVRAQIPAPGEDASPRPIIGRRRRRFCRRMLVNERMIDVDGIGLGIAAGVFDEIATREGRSEWNYRYEKVSSAIPEWGEVADTDANRRGQYSDQMPWTKEREEFFARIINGMTGLILQMHDALRYTDDALDFADGKRTFIAAADGLLRLK